MADNSGLPIGKILETKGKTLTVIDASGQVVSRTGDKNWRNNNQGNLRAFDATGKEYPFTKSSPGYLGADPDGFAIFDTPEHGAQAQKNLLLGPNYRNLTIGDAIGKYDSAEQVQYKKLMQQQGFNLNTKISNLPTSEQLRLADTMGSVAEGRLYGKITVQGTPTEAQLKSNSNVQNKVAPQESTNAVQQQRVAVKLDPNSAQGKKAKDLANQVSDLDTQIAKSDDPSPAGVAKRKALIDKRNALAAEYTNLTTKTVDAKGEPLPHLKGANGPAGTPGAIATNQRRADVNKNGIIQSPSSSNSSRDPNRAGFGLGSDGDFLKREPGYEESKKRKNKPALALDPLPNVLHQYATYTYGLSLHLMSSAEYNEVVRTETYTPKRVLVASAGRHNPQSFPRSPFFSEDFYFQELNLSSLIAPNSVSRNTNALEGSFTLVEPYGMTFLNQLIAATEADDIKSQSYLDMPYLLQIDFFAASDTGELLGVIPDLTKRIPIKFIKMDIRASTKGAEYKVQFVPFNHSAYESTSVSTPALVTVTAKTVSQFFQGRVQKPDASDAQERSGGMWRYDDNRYVGPDGQFINMPKTAAGPATKKEMAKISSFAGALNTWYNEIKTNNKIKTNDKYFFEFDDEIADAQFTYTNKISPKDTRMASKGDIVIRQSSLGKDTDSYDTTMREFSINPGTSIEKVINFIVRNSDYIQRQLVIPEDYGNNIEAYQKAKQDNADQPLKWFKIVPIVKLGEFDTIRKVWSREITYYVKTYEIRNVRMDVSPQGTAEYPCKVYDYIYTGKNDDVIDFDIHFEMLYFNAITAYRDSLKQTYTMATDTAENAKSKNPENYTGSAQDPNAVMPNVIKPVVMISKNTTSSGTVTAREVAISDLEESLMTLSQADMLNVKLKIIGDPHFIKQDDVFYSPRGPSNANTKKSIHDSSAESKTAKDPRLTPNNSIITDNGQVYVHIQFRTPIDIDESTGLMRYDSKYKLSVFSGLYMILRIDSQFSNGQFIQTLDLVRLPNQIKFDYVDKKSKAKSVERNEGTSAAASAPAADSVTASNTTTGTGATDPAGSNQTGQQQTANSNAQAAPAIDQGLAQVNNTTQATPINASTEPQAVIPVAESISFNEAFRRARAANGGKPGGVFKWNGATYQTNVEGEAYVANPTPVTYK